MHPHQNSQSPSAPRSGQQQPGYYGQDEHDPYAAAQAAYPTPPNGPYQTPAGPNPYYPGVTTSVNPTPYAYAAPYQYANTSGYPATPSYGGGAGAVGESSYAAAGYATGGSVGGGYTYAAPLTSPLTSPSTAGPSNYFPAAESSQAGGSSYTSPGGTTHTLAENEALLKRLRNTAASARFRAKKKQRERSLEERERDKREELERLEERIRELELENRFLKGLVWAPREGKKDEKEKPKDGKNSSSDEDAKSTSSKEKSKGKGKGKAKS